MKKADLIQKSKRVVIKIGSALLIDKKKENKTQTKKTQIQT